jgi:hypothetical protein
MEDELLAGSVICNCCGYEQDVMGTTLAEIKHHTRCDWCGTDDLRPGPDLMQFKIELTPPKPIPKVDPV